MEVGFIGLGSMGSAMAQNLVRAGHSVRTWDRTPGRGVDGARPVAEVGEALQANVVFTMLSDDLAIQTVLLDSGALKHARLDLIHVVTSTISVAFADILASIHDNTGLRYLSAPVLGLPDRAARGELDILAGGKPEVLNVVQPLLNVLGKKTWFMGNRPSQANAAKIAANMMITMAIEALAEAVVIVESVGLQRQTFFDLILRTLFSGRPYESYSSNIAQNQYDPGFKAYLGLKDLGLAIAAAPHRLSMLEAVRETMRRTVASGRGDRDWSVIADFTIMGEARES